MSQNPKKKKDQTKKVVKVSNLKNLLHQKLLQLKRKLLLIQTKKDLKKRKKRHQSHHL